MKRKQFSEEQIIGILKEAEARQWFSDGKKWGHRVIDLVSPLDGTKSRERFNAGGWPCRSMQDWM